MIRIVGPASLIALTTLAAALVGCGPEEVPVSADRLAPRTQATLVYPTGTRVGLSNGQTIPVNTVDVGLELALPLDDPGDIFYTTDGTSPASNPEAIRVEQRTTITLRDTTTVRYFGLDLAGNEEALQQVVVEFDRTPPMPRIDPPPGEYAGMVTVEVTADEPGSVYWTVDGTPPVRGTVGTEEAELPASIDLILPVELRLIVEDAVGNDVAVGPLTYVIDAEAPTTFADPPPGLYLAPVDVVLTTDDPTGVVRYTTDGSAPDETSAVYGGPIAVERDLVLTVRAYDEGGNAEMPRMLAYAIGPRGPVAPAEGAEPTAFPLAGGLSMAAALFDVSGALAGRPAPSTGADWTVWSLARMATDATLLYSGVGPHAMNSTALIDVSAAGEGVPDANGNGSNLDETFFARVDALAEQVGESRVPDGLHPPSVLLVRGDATLAAPLPARRTLSGRPAWSDDYRQMRWNGAGADDRTTGVDPLAAGLRALAARARTALVVQHPVGEGAYARSAGPVVGLRCVSCHGAAVEPAIAGPAELDALGLLAGDNPRLLDLLSGDERHLVDPATPEEVDLVAEWIAAGAQFRPDAAQLPGADAREGLLGLLAIEHAGVLMHETAERLMFDVELGRIAPFDPLREQYVVGEADLILGAGQTGTAALDVVQVVDRTFRTSAQSRLLAALVAWVELVDGRPELFEGPLAGSEAFGGVAGQARVFAEALLAELLERVTGDEGVPRASWNPGSGRASQVEARALADFAVALRAAGRVLGDGRASTAADAAVAFLIDALRRPDGDYADTWRDGEQVPEARQLVTQWAVLTALLDAAAAGDAAALDAAEDLWGRIDGNWFDPDARLWQTVRGFETWSYDPALVARTLDALGAAASAGLIRADARLSSALDRLVIPFVWADTWLSGERTAGADVDGDGLPKPQDAGPDNGVAPVFRRQIDL